MTADPKLRVLYLHPAAAFGGAAKSLLELLKAIPDDRLDSTILCPRGTAANEFRKHGFQVAEVVGLAQWDDTRYGHYRGLRWIVLLRELLLWPATLIALLRARRLGPFDIVHINDITLLFAGTIAGRLLRVPLVVHVRSLQRGSKGDWRTRFLNRWLEKNASGIVAIDETVRRTLPQHLEVKVIHNGLHVSGADRQGRNGTTFRVGIVGVLLKLKGVYEFVEAAKLCLDRGMQVEFLVVGENVRPVTGLYGSILKMTGLAHDVEKDLRETITANSLENNVRLTGFIRDVQAVYQELDVLCFPSYLNAAGRPVFEAAYFQVPSIVAVKDPPPDTIIPGQTGLCIAEPDALELANAIEYLYNNPDERKRMGKMAAELARRHFDIGANSTEMLSLYREIHDTARRAG